MPGNSQTRILCSTLAALFAVAGCSAQRYRPAPIAPGTVAASFEARSLSDAQLRAFEERCLGHAIDWPLEVWDDKSLAIAAWYFNPQLERARAHVEESEAQVISAGARPNPTLGITPGVPSPYLLTLDLSFPIETAGKRNYRLQAARNLADAARLDLAAAAWSLRNDVRAALLDLLLGQKSVELLRSEVQLREDQVRLLQRAAVAGEIAPLEADRARIELSRAHAALGNAEEQMTESQAALAAAIGIPIHALEPLRLSWPDLESPPSAESLPASDVRREAVLNKLSVRSALAQYAAAESDLQLEVAKQYPDINLGPGYSYEESRSYFTLGFSATLPLFDRNQGPIAVAEAGRRIAAAAFIETQTQVIEKSDRALMVYQAALRNFVEAQRFSELQARQRDAARQAARLGEQDRLALDDAEIETSIAARTRLEALSHAQHALGDLEDAVERPLTPGDEMAPVGDQMLEGGVASPR